MSLPAPGRLTMRGRASIAAKKRLGELGLGGSAGILRSKAGCLRVCAIGPVAVVYPEGVWYTYHNEADIDEILQKHVLEGHIVERLQLKVKK